MKNLWILSAVILFSICKVSAQTVIAAKDAANHIGEKVRVCDKVFRENNKAFAVSLYLGDSTSHFVIITIRFSSKFRDSIPHDYFNFVGKQICATGIVLKGPFIKVNDPAQIKIVDTANQPAKTN